MFIERHFITIVEPHVCSHFAVEVGLSECKFGCKSYQCKRCGTCSVLHSRTYGCTYVNYRYYRYNPKHRPSA